MRRTGHVLLVTVASSCGANGRGSVSTRLPDKLSTSPEIFNDRRGSVGGAVGRAVGRAVKGAVRGAVRGAVAGNLQIRKGAHCTSCDKSIGTGERLWATESYAIDPY